MKRICFSSLVFFQACVYEDAPVLSMAKELCSCLFVAEMPEAYCKGLFKDAKLLSKAKIDYKSKVVVAESKINAFTLQSKAFYRNEKFGCTLSDLVRKD